MSERLKRIQGMAQRYNKLGVVKNETLSAINDSVAARNIPEVRAMTAEQIKSVRVRNKLSQSALARTIGMSVESVSKWERAESKPNQAALRILNIIEDKGVEIFIV